MKKAHKTPRTIAELFDVMKSRITVSERGCWIYPSSGRYGVIGFNGKKIKTHRVAYLHTCGDIPEGHEICHKCDVGVCCNPDHLFLGTHKDNMMDMASKNRHFYGERWTSRMAGVDFSNKGAANGRSILSDSDVVAIRSIPETSLVAARLFGVCRATIHKIRQKKLWKHIPQYIEEQKNEIY